MPEVLLKGGPVEYLRIEGDPDLPALVLLHEGLGCAARWRRFPAQLARTTGRTVVTFSRHGYGGSWPFDGPFPVSYLHDQARGPLQEFLDALGLTSPVLVGHSDGASIALVHAAEQPVSGLVLMAPHVIVEPRTLEGIRATAEEFATGGLAARLAVFHDDPATVFERWSTVWLSEGFRDWSVTELLPLVDCPVLLVQGEDDPYGTRHQLDTVVEGVSGPVRRIDLPDCGHEPHRERATEVLAAIAEMLPSWGSAQLHGGVDR
ncbi:alpha/beta fold hydrolase [Streptomyces sp. NPDC056500]|uniref:alpha/beta fold hydrolase n=1 Tax=Streptomyces sp. NPDC056500 TaxID=3345840 RepID=UPI0036B95297